LKASLGATLVAMVMIAPPLPSLDIAEFMPLIDEGDI
jgi:hypothetical protein